MEISEFQSKKEDRKVGKYLKRKEALLCKFVCDTTQMKTLVERATTLQ